MRISSGGRIGRDKNFSMFGAKENGDLNMERDSIGTPRMT